MTHEATIDVRWPLAEGLAQVATPVAFGVRIAKGLMRLHSPCPGTPAEGSVANGPPSSLPVEKGVVRVEMPGGRTLVAQTTPLGFWHDGTVRWLLVECVVPAGEQLGGQLRVVLNGEQPSDRPENRSRTSKAAYAIGSNDGGGLSVRIERRSGAWSIHKAQRSLASAALPTIEDQHGRRHTATVKDVRMLAAGPVQATVEIEGIYRRLRGLRVMARWKFWAETGLAEGAITLGNPRRARHRGGLWDLGDPGSVLLKDFTQTVAMHSAGDAAVRYRIEPGGPVREAAGPVVVYQDSSGGENWNSRNHVNRHGDVPLRLRGYEARAGRERLAGLRSQPLVAVVGGGFEIAAEIEDFWQQFPKAIEARPGAIHLGLFPRQFGDSHELQGGEQKTHRMWLSFTATSQSKEKRAAVVRSIPPLSPPPSVPGLPDWQQANVAVLRQLDELAAEFLDGPRGLHANRERVDEYGWRNWGEVHADHEELHYHGPQPLISHYNNQFDLVAGFVLQYLRTGETRWWKLAEPLARHVIDIDIYHTNEDRPAYNGGLFWFTDHYLPAHTSTHRTYSRENRKAGCDYGGGPAASHCFSTGLLLYHLLTGDSQAKVAVVTLADWIIAMDDGRRTVLGLVDDGPTGLASATSDLSYHGPGRGAGNSLNTLLDAWLASGERKYLEYAEALIRRAIHPQDDIAALDLLNAEKRWSYTVFLVSLDKYLRCKAEVDECDAMVVYARASLLAYGRWMADHERPYLDRIEELEYPTEAWPAQELRKANALRLAAAYANGGEQQRMYERGDELARRAWSDLARFTTRATARAVAVVLVEGLRDAEVRQRPLVAAPYMNGHASLPFPPYNLFVPQRERVKKKLRSVRGLGSLLVQAASPARWPRILNKH